MASRAYDQFIRPNGPGLGTTDTGQPWLQHRGAAEIKNYRAFFPPSNPGAMWTVDTGAGGGDATVSCDFPTNDGGGQALYFRVRDVNHWWRLSKRKYTYSYTYQSGTTDPVYGWVGNGTYYYEPAGGWVKTGEWALDPSEGAYGQYFTQYYTWDSRVNAYLGRQDYVYTKAISYQWRTVHENQEYRQIGGGEPIYSTGYATAVEVQLHKCVNGAVSLVRSAGASDSIGRFEVVLDKDSISCLVAGSAPWATFKDSTLQTAQRHGIGYAETSPYGNNGGIETFSAQPFVITGYVPPVML